MRTCAPHLLENSLIKFDAAIDASIHNIVGQSVSGALRKIWALPFRLAGMGIPIPSEHAQGSFAASSTFTWTLQEQLGATRPRNGTADAYNSYSDNIFDINDLNTNKLCQGAFKAKLDSITYQILLNTSDQRTQALLKSKTMKNAQAWLTAIPSTYNGQYIQPLQFQSLLKFHTGMEIRSNHVQCAVCRDNAKKNTPLDKLGDHAITCGSSGQRIAKHNLVIKFITENLKAALMLHQTEERVDHAALGDIFILDWIAGRDLYVDVSITNPLCPSYRNLAAREVGGAKEAREKQKRDKYKTVIEENNLLFQPIVADTLGGWGPEARRFFEKIVKAVATYKRTEFKSEMNVFMTGLSCRLQKSNALMLTTRMYA